MRRSILLAAAALLAQGCALFVWREPSRSRDAGRRSSPGLSSAEGGRTMPDGGPSPEQGLDLKDCVDLALT